MNNNPGDRQVGHISWQSDVTKAQLDRIESKIDKLLSDRNRFDDRVNQKPQAEKPHNKTKWSEFDGHDD